MDGWLENVKELKMDSWLQKTRGSEDGRLVRDNDNGRLVRESDNGRLVRESDDERLVSESDNGGWMRDGDCTQPRLVAPTLTMGEYGRTRGWAVTLLRMPWELVLR